MGALLLWLLMQMELFQGSSYVYVYGYGYVDWADGENARGDAEAAQKPTARATIVHRLEEDVPKVVAAFLHTGDSSTLTHANCSRRYELGGLRTSSSSSSSSVSRHSLRPAVEAVGRAASLLNGLQPLGDGQQQRDAVWLGALVRSMLDADPRIHRAALALQAEPRLLLQATRSGGHVAVRNMKESDHEEFRERKRTHGGRGRGHEPGEIKWSAPYLECEHGSFAPHWLLTLSAGIYSPAKDAAVPELRGIVKVDVNLQDEDIDQCSSSGWFAGTHRCNLTTMECKPVPGHGFVLDKYKCQCKRGFYSPRRVALNGVSKSEQGLYSDDSSDSSARCLPCREGCSFCQDDSPCLAQEDGVLRVAVASFQGLCMLLDFISMPVVYHFRRNKRIRASGLILLEAILAGAILLYFPVMILYFQPSVFRCVLLRWVRLLGFTTVYGTVILKLYRVLKVFLSRTAQRIPYMTSWRVLRLLAAILLVVLWFLVAWTSAMCQSTDVHHTLVDVGVTPEGLQFNMCMLDRWDYMMAVAEFLFLLWGVYLCYAVRTVPSAFHEPRYMAVAIYNELLISAIFHIIRFTLAPGLHPDWMLMLFFVHTHLTVTVTLGLLLIPKFVFTETHMQDDIATEAYEDELDMGRSGSYLNSSITSAWSEHSLDPEDIREELKKLYSQLEVYKRKKMLANNPHLQKKRSSKKGIGRSLMRRITEIPETRVSRQYSREDRDGSEHGSNRSTLRRNPFEPSHSGKSREDSLKSRMFSLKRSHSYDHSHDQGENANGGPAEKLENSTTESSLLDTLMGRKSAKKNSEVAKVEPAESAESVPLVCKSASAHNLAADKKPVHLRTSMLQKSLSVIASARERTLGLAGKTHSVEDASKKGLKARDTRMLSEVDESPECFPKMIISQSVEYTKTPSKMGIMKQQVSGSQPSICSEPGRSRDLYDLSEVCPWEMEDLPTPSEGKSQKHVSIAPSETNTIHGTSYKSGRSQHKQKTSVQSPSNRRRSRDKGSSKEEECDARREHEGRKLKSPLKLTAHKAETCPWEYEDPAAAKGLEPERINRKKSVTPTDGNPKILLSDLSKSTGSLLQPPALMVEICPWDYDQPPSPSNQEKTSSPTHYSKRRDSNAKRKGSCSSRGKGKDKDEDKQRSKSRERRSSSSKPSEKRRISQTSDSSQVSMTGSGRRRSSTKELGITDSSKHAEACPWETEVVPSVISKDKQSSSRGNHTTSQTPTAASAPPAATAAPAASKLSTADVCPWDFEDKSLGNRA
ncbi:probable G-protein coupled receptor 158 isoform X2 [Astyanax mexicanus]|uniref:probable G-protein coupled receptor 158 isoform X2 n=1 Tax=Astyanax mexicanus TaxID=7994 RepID=UPI0020CAFDA9|nr:probable G-protein coupled receptor 158 isoform X2 [Astyanax mexicanus]